MQSPLLYIFDLDGTLLNLEHRLHFIQSTPKDWRGFFAAVDKDEPKLPVIRVLQALRSSGAEIWVWSGRSDECRVTTIEWLCRHGCFGGPTETLPAWPFGAPERFRMRKAGDRRDDAILKQEWLNQVRQSDRDRLVGVFDDRDRVVAMWRRNDIQCFQVAPGDF